MSIDHKIEHIRKVKRAEYGSFTKNLELIGKTWSALLDLPTPIPPYKVALMYAASKVIRAAHTYKEGKSDLDLTTYCRNAEGGMFNYFQNNGLIEKFNEFRHLSANYEFKN